MAYVAVKGGERAIRTAHAWVAEQLAGRTADAGMVRQILDTQRLAVDRVMAEGSLYAPGLAARALLQAQGDVIEAVFLLRVFRGTLTRLADSEPIETSALQPLRRISAAFKDMPGGQRLGGTYDYSHRLLGYFEQVEGGSSAPLSPEPDTDIMALLVSEGLLEPEPQGSASMAPEFDITREPMAFPAQRSARLQALARGDEGFLLGLAYSTQRGYGQTHPFLGELRKGTVEVEMLVPPLGEVMVIGQIQVTECQMINQFQAIRPNDSQFTRGYGLVLGDNERKAMAMALLDRAMRAEELGETAASPGQDVEFVLSHCDNVAATGFVEHLKLPHHVDFQSEIESLRALRGRPSPTGQLQGDDDAGV